MGSGASLGIYGEVLMQFLRQVGEEILSKQSLVSMLLEELAGYKPARSHKTIHASALTKPEGFCPREYALLYATEKSLPKVFVGAAMQVAFDNGNALAELCRNRWLKSRVVGHWECSECGHVHKFAKLPKRCVGCGRHNCLEYNEVNFVDPVTKASGSIDFFIDFGTGKLIMVEVKSISKDDFAVLVSPMGEHRVRTQVYLELIERAGGEKDGIETAFGIVLYISKGYGKHNEEFGKVIPFKEYRVEKNKAFATPYLDRADKVEQYLTKGVMPAGICSSPLIKRAKACSVCEECWSGDYPAGTTK